MDGELVAKLEDRWSRMGEAIQRLQHDRDALHDDILAKDEIIKNLTEEKRLLETKIAAILQEKTEISGRVEKMLSRFEDYGI